MSPAAALESVLESIDSPEPLSFPLLLDRIYAARYTGSITVHFYNGRPQRADFQTITRVEFAVSSPTGLDSRNLPQAP